MTLTIDDDFERELDARWYRSTPGGGAITVGASALRLALPEGARQGRYSNAQIDDYGRLPIARYPWRPPLRLTVRARASHQAHPATDERVAGDESNGYLRGTAGFGFWNAPLTIAGGAPRLPESVWFFAASPPSNMALVPGIPGWGWKAQVVHAQRWDALALVAPTLGAMVAAKLTGRGAAAARWTQRLSGASEALLSVDLREWHEYVIEWRSEAARFFVDGAEALVAPNPPRGPLGFVAWIDNQYAIATPTGRFGFGTLTCGPQQLEIDHLRITPL